jgi:hypothetical protein
MTRTPSSRRRLGSLVVLAVVAVALASCTVAPAGSAQSDTVELRWYCWNGIFTPAGPDGDRWWAGGFPVPTGPLEADAGPDDGNHEHHSTGVLHVEGPTAATFTAAAGGQLALTRVAADVVFPAYCQLTSS